MNLFTNRESKLWNCYETWSPVITIPSFSIFCGDFIARLTTIFEPSLPSLVQLVQQWIMFLAPFATSILVAIIFLDNVKFKATKDPRDEPGRKWWSTQYSGRYLPTEIVILPSDIAALRNEALTIQLSTFKNHECPKCGVTHAFKVHEHETRTCCFYGCSETIAPPIS